MSKKREPVEIPEEIRRERFQEAIYLMWEAIRVWQERKKAEKEHQEQEPPVIGDSNDDEARD